MCWRSDTFVHIIFRWRPQILLSDKKINKILHFILIYTHQMHKQIFNLATPAFSSGYARDAFFTFLLTSTYMYTER